MSGNDIPLAGSTAGRLRAFLAAAQLSITVAVFANVLEISLPLLQQANRTTGLDEDDAFLVTSIGERSDFEAESVIDDDLRAIRETPGVLAATPAMGAPLTGLEVTVGVTTEFGVPPVLRAAVYHVDEQGLKGLGVNLVRGHSFARDHVVREASISNGSWPVVIVSRALAEILFGTPDVVGRRIFVGGQRTTTIIGVIERLDGPLPQTPSPQRERSMLVPQLLTMGRESRYLIRTEAGQLHHVMKEVSSHLAESNRDRVIRDVMTLHRVRLLAYGVELATVTALAALIGLLLATNAIGIYAMTSFWTTEQIKEIGIRRAVGASRSVVAYELMKQIATPAALGVIVGAVLAWTVNQLLLTQFELSAISPETVIVGASLVFFWALSAAVGPVVGVIRVPIAVALKRL